MSTANKYMQSASGAGGDALNVEDVFSTYLYAGTGSTQTITNGIDLDGEGGLVWAKIRDTSSTNHMLVDTERGTSNVQRTNFSSADQTGTFLNSFNSNGFTLANNFDMNGSGYDIASWTFRKAPKFFDVVTYTGSDSTQTINHSLASEVGFMVVKRVSSGTGQWYAHHRSLTSGHIIKLNSTDASTSNASSLLYNVTSTSFTVDAGAYHTNAAGETYVAYLFAHNNNDGDFGPDGDQDIIKCGSYTGTGAAGNFVDLGFEPQWLLLKRTDSTEDWPLVDSMRGFVAGGNVDRLRANSDSEEISATNRVEPNSTGFTLKSSSNEYNGSGGTYIYIAIRRGPMAVPESGTDILNIGTRNESGNAPPMYHAGRVVDMAWQREVTTSNNPTMASRLTGNNFLRAYDPSTLTSSSQHAFDYSDGWYNNTETNTNAYSYMFSRAVGAFDVVAYTGNGTSGNGIQHGLGVAPEFIMIHSYGNRNWQIGSQLLDNQAYGYTESSYMYQNGAGNSIFPNTSHTSTHFYVGSDSDVNNNNEKYIAHLWASVDGVIKCGVYTGNGSNSRDIDCGFTSGARFVLLGNCDDSDYSRILFDTDRGITTGAGDNPLSFFYPIPVGYVNSPSGYADLSTTDFIDPISSGFRIKSSSGHTNASGKKYLYMAIA